MKDFAKSIVCNTKAEAEKVGNATPNYRYKGFLITNPEGYEYVVYLQDGIHVAFRGTTSKAMAEDWCDNHDPKTNKPIGNSKVGNFKIDDKEDNKDRLDAAYKDKINQAKEYLNRIAREISDYENKQGVTFRELGYLRRFVDELKAIV